MRTILIIIPTNVFYHDCVQCSNKPLVSTSWMPSKVNNYNKWWPPPPPPHQTESNSFVVAYVCTKKHPCEMLATPLPARGPPAPQRETLDPSLLSTKYTVKLYFCCSVFSLQPTDWNTSTLTSAMTQIEVQPNVVLTAICRMGNQKQDSMPVPLECTKIYQNRSCFEPSWTLTVMWSSGFFPNFQCYRLQMEGFGLYSKKASRTDWTVRRDWITYDAWHRRLSAQFKLFLEDCGTRSVCE